MLEENDPEVKPGDPYPYEGKENPFTDLLEQWPPEREEPEAKQTSIDWNERLEDFLAGTTSIQAADEEGWIVSITRPTPP